MKRRAAWLETYPEAVISVLNTHKGYIIQQAKVVLTEKWKMLVHIPDGEILPTPERMQQIVLRQLDPENEADVEAFKWYHEEYLPAVAGNPIWGPQKHQYNLISEGKVSRKSDELLIPASTEAFGWLIHDNGYDMYLAQAAWKAKEENKNSVLPIQKPNDPNKLWWPKYSAGAGRSQKHGGWDSKGKKFFAKAIPLIEQARKTAISGDIEKKVLDQIQEAHEITQPTYEAQKKSKRRKTAPPPQEEEEDDVDLAALMGK